MLIVESLIRYLIKFTPFFGVCFVLELKFYVVFNNSFVLFIFFKVWVYLWIIINETWYFCIDTMHHLELLQALQYSEGWREGCKVANITTTAVVSHWSYLSRAYFAWMAWGCLSWCISKCRLTVTVRLHRAATERPNYCWKRSMVAMSKKILLSV